MYIVACLVDGKNFNCGSIMLNLHKINSGINHFYSIHVFVIYQVTYILIIIRPTRVHSAVLNIIFAADSENVLTNALIKALFSLLYTYCGKLLLFKARNKSGSL